MVDEPTLIQKAIEGEPAAFDELVAPYQSQLTAWLGYVLGEDGEDCLQEVLLAAWLKLPQLKQAERFKAWLFQIARNRCMDYLRIRQRINQVESPLEGVVGYLGRMPDFELPHRIDDLIGDLTDAERQTVWMHYIEGLPVDEISRQREVSPGTIKRLLHNGRKRMREAIHRQEQEGEQSMSKPKRILLPEIRPEIRIRSIEVQPFTVDLREQPWFFILLEPGAKAQWAMYDPPDWRRTDVCDIHVSSPARVHGLDCLEVVSEWYEAGQWKETRKSYVQHTGDYSQTLATISDRNGVPNINTFLDEAFIEQWGSKETRLWKDEGRFSGESNRLSTLDSSKSGGAGFFEVSIGRKSFTCLRVFDTSRARGEDGILVEAYLSQAGRTVLFRRYNGLRWRRLPDWFPQAQANPRVFLDGVEYVHWYDSLSNYGIG